MSKKTFSIFTLKDDGSGDHFVGLRHAENEAQAIEEVSEDHGVYPSGEYGLAIGGHIYPEDQLSAVEVNVPDEPRKPWWRR